MAKEGRVFKRSICTRQADTAQTLLRIGGALLGRSQGSGEGGKEARQVVSRKGKTRSQDRHGERTHVMKYTHNTTRRPSYCNTTRQADAGLCNRAPAWARSDHVMHVPAKTTMPARAASPRICSLCLCVGVGVSWVVRRVRWGFAQSAPKGQQCKQSFDRDDVVLDFRAQSKK